MDNEGDGARQSNSPCTSVDVETKGKSPWPKQALRGLIRDISKEPTNADFKDDQKLREKYKRRVLSLIQRWTQVSAAGNFVNEVLKTRVISHEGDEILFQRKHKLFLLEIAIPEDWHQLEYQPTGSKEPTPFHRAIEIDKKNRNDDHSSSSFFTSLFCKLMERGIQSGVLTKELAASIISRTNAEGATCLHLALMEDLEVAENLIRLADHATFKQARENGNTPLHDALEFPIEPKLAKLRYLVPAPKCKTPSLLTPMHEFTQLGDKTQPSDCCIQCQTADDRYQKLKERRSKIICELLRKCPAALGMQNSDGKSPFSYHVMAREEFRKKYPNFSIPTTSFSSASSSSGTDCDGMAQLGDSLTTNSSPAAVNAVSSDPDVSPTRLEDAITATGESSNALDEGARRANVGAPKFPMRRSAPPNPEAASPVAPANTSQDHAGQQQSESASETEDCSPDSPRDCYHLSVEVEELLWEVAFCIGGYENARRCLFWARDAHEENDVETFSEDEELDRVFIPTGRVTTETINAYKNFKFEPTLAYVHLKVTPSQGEEGSLTTPEARAEWRENSSQGLKVLFNWLTGRKGVKRILKLVVEDNDAFPCNEETIRNCLSKLDDIRYLDWRRPNISAQSLLKAKQVVELWLYSTGINAVLSSWSDKGGLQNLEKLQTVYLDAKQGNESEKTNDDNVQTFISRLNEWYDEQRKPPEVVPKYESTGSKGNQDSPGGGGTGPQRSNPWLQKMENLTAALNKISSPEVPEDDSGTVSRSGKEATGVDGSSDYVKVALLDDGVDPEWGGLGKFLSGRGWPPLSEYVGEHGPAVPFYSSGEMKHGNRMAKLITMACPFVRIYVAKIDTQPDAVSSHPTFDVTQAIDAIQWARRQKVDIISMSWNVMLAATDPDKKKLQDAIREAERQNILMYCAASEKKPSKSDNKPWPSSCTETFSIGAASNHRIAKEYVDGDAQFLFPSDSVLDDGNDGGNSGAAALAVGLASLILFCLKRNRRNQGHKHVVKEEQAEGEDNQTSPEQLQPLSAAGEDPRDMMEKVFGSLSRDRGSKYVDIDALLDKEKGKVSYETITKHCEAYIKTNAVKSGTKT